MVTSNWIVDCSHWQSEPGLLTRLKMNGIKAVIHKATQGVQAQDQLFAQRKKEASDLGLLWGAYHFGVGADGARQASNFLATAGIGGVQVFDFEDYADGPSMTVAQAFDFVYEVVKQTGKWPVVYADPSHIKVLLEENSFISQNCPLWVAEYNANPTDPVAAHSWPTTWKIRQWSDGSSRFNPERWEQGIDADQFNGTEDDMRAFWAAQQV